MSYFNSNLMVIIIVFFLKDLNAYNENLGELGENDSKAGVNFLFSM